MPTLAACASRVHVATTALSARHRGTRGIAAEATTARSALLLRCRAQSKCQWVAGVPNKSKGPPSSSKRQRATRTASSLTPAAAPRARANDVYFVQFMCPPRKRVSSLKNSSVRVIYGSAIEVERDGFFFREQHRSCENISCST